MSTHRIPLRRWATLGPLALILMAAAPPSNGFTTTPMFAQATIGAVTLVPEATTAVRGGFTPAPLPDYERGAPVIRTLGPAQPEFSPSIIRPRATYRGEGYVFGSTVQGSQEKNFHPAPGVSLKMPLE